MFTLDLSACAISRNEYDALVTLEWMCWNNMCSLHDVVFESKFTRVYMSMYECIGFYCGFAGIFVDLDRNWKNDLLTCILAEKDFLR